MILKNVTITGADNKTDIDDLYYISSNYPFVEWGILWYPKKMGDPRYPTQSWISKFLIEKPAGVNTSMHVCGIDAHNFGYRIDESPMWDYYVNVDRVQLNYPNNEFSLDDVLALLQRGRYDFRYAVNRFHALTPGKYVIIQANEGNKILNACLEKEPAIEFLFDASRGNGKRITEYPKPIPQKYNGYAGGIDPKNVMSVLHDLNKIVPEKDEIWIDLETGVRTNNELDLSKVESVLSDCTLWMENH
jgi:hypothetical protein